MGVGSFLSPVNTGSQGGGREIKRSPFTDSSREAGHAMQKLRQL